MVSGPRRGVQLVGRVRSRCRPAVAASVPLAEVAAQRVEVGRQFLGQADRARISHEPVSRSRRLLGNKVVSRSGGGQQLVGPAARWRISP